MKMKMQLKFKEENEQINAARFIDEQPFLNYLAEHLDKAKSLGTSKCYEVEVAFLMWAKERGSFLVPSSCFNVWEWYCYENSLKFNPDDVGQALEPIAGIIEIHYYLGSPNCPCIGLTDEGFEKLKQQYK